MVAATGEGRGNQGWNDTADTLVAPMTLHGDWMKGRWRTNDKEVGVDFICLDIAGARPLRRG